MKTIREIAAFVFEEPIENLNAASSPNNVKKWDSFKHIQFISEVERHFMVRLTTQNTNDANTLGALKGILLGLGVTEGIDV